MELQHRASARHRFCDAHPQARQPRRRVDGRRRSSGTGTHGRGTPSIDRCHSTNVFLNHTQMDPETVQIDFEWARNLERPHSRFNFCESCLILAKPGPLGAVSEFAFKISQSSVQLVDATNVEPPVKPRCKADDGNESCDNRNDKEYDSSEQRAQPERRVALPEARAG